MPHVIPIVLFCATVIACPCFCNVHQLKIIYNFMYIVNRNESWWARGAHSSGVCARR